jgi:hypothetical protein
LAFRLQPETEEVVCIAGTAGFDRLWAEQCHQVLDGYRERVRYRFIGTGPLAETLAAIHKLPPKSIVLYISILRDGRGDSFVPMQVAGTDTAEASRFLSAPAQSVCSVATTIPFLFDIQKFSELY